MNTLRPVSMQRIHRVISTHDVSLEGVGSVAHWDLGGYCTLTCSLDDPAVLHFKGQSKRHFRGPESFQQLAHFVTQSNRSRAFPKAYVESLSFPIAYTVSAEVNRLVTSGLSNLQFNAFIEHTLHTLTDFFKEFDRMTSHTEDSSSGGHLAEVVSLPSRSVSSHADPARLGGGPSD